MYFTWYDKMYFTFVDNHTQTLLIFENVFYVVECTRVIIRENKFSLLRKAHNLIIDENKKHN